MMKPVFTAAKAAPQRIVYAEGEDERVLRAVQVVVDEGLAKPILIGRPAVIEQRLERFGLRMQPGRDFDLINPESDDRATATTGPSTTASRSARACRRQYAQVEMRRRLTLIGAVAIYKGEADGMLCGMFGTYTQHLQLHRRGARPAPRRAELRGDERGDAACRARCSSATPT